VMSSSKSQDYLSRHLINNRNSESRILWRSWEDCHSWNPLRTSEGSWSYRRRLLLFSQCAEGRETTHPDHFSLPGHNISKCPRSGRAIVRKRSGCAAPHNRYPASAAHYRALARFKSRSQRPWSSSLTDSMNVKTKLRNPASSNKFLYIQTQERHP